jgi:25S rRNA (adenine2142-N1)-methyltransferase
MRGEDCVTEAWRRLLVLTMTRKRKQPIVYQTTTTSIAAQSCRTTIRQYHLLLKRRQQLEQAKQTIALAEIDQQIASLGGLERYQQMSSLGQLEDRGGGSEKVFIQWMKAMRKAQSNPPNIR